MAFPPLCFLAGVEDYRARFEAIYCCGPIMTFDGISVRFQKSDFDHCFYESSKRNGVKDTFSQPRSERIDWIKAALEDPTAELYVGWDSSKRRYDQGRRVCVVCGNFVVIFRIVGTNSARFVTAYVADTGRTLTMIKKSPIWAK